MSGAASPPAHPDPFRRLAAIMAQLRNPDGGCPWDLEQNFATIAPYTIEEAYEVADAIERGNPQDLKEELGDLLLQVVFHSQMAAELGQFTLDDVAEAICAKMIQRHPHVFSEPLTGGAAAQTVRWEEIKAEERKAKGGSVTKTRTLDDVPLPLPALVRALKLQQRAARVSFDWGNADAVFEKLTEEIGEFHAELNRPDRQAERLQDELGDMLFCMVNIARHLGIDPETALRSTNNKFRRRFNRVEDFLDEEGLTPQSSSLDHMESLWQKAKQEERS